MDKLISLTCSVICLVLFFFIIMPSNNVLADKDDLCDQENDIQADSSSADSSIPTSKAEDPGGNDKTSLDINCDDSVSSGQSSGSNEENNAAKLEDNDPDASREDDGKFSPGEDEEHDQKAGSAAPQYPEADIIELNPEALASEVDANVKSSSNEMKQQPGCKKCEDQDEFAKINKEKTVLNLETQDDTTGNLEKADSGKQSGKATMTAESHTEIEKQGDFDLIRNDLSGHFKLINDIQLTGNWEPIGQDTDGKSPFSGTFDGQGFTISDLIIGNNDLPEGYNAGFFGHTSGATIKNVNLREVDVSGSGNVGTLAGKAKNTIVENCTVSGTVQGSGNNVGGLVGQAANVSITNSSVSGEVSGDANMVGGLVGNMTDYNYSTEAKISFSFADAEVSGNQGVGGLVGSTQSKSNINDSYATGMVEGDCCIGGLAGGVFKDTSIKNCYSSSTVNLTNQSAANTGGLAGYAHPETIDQNNYWNICQSGLAESALGTGNTNEQMMRASSFEKWDFEQTWHIREGSGSPILKWQLEHENSNDNEQSGQENEKGDYRSPKKLFSSGFFMFAMDYSPCLSLNIETAVDLILAKLEKVDLLLEVMLDKEKVDLEELNLAMGLLEEVRGLLTRYADQLEDIEHLQLSEKVEEQMNLVAGLIAAN